MFRRRPRLDQVAGHARAVNGIFQDRGGQPHAQGAEVRRRGRMHERDRTAAVQLRKERVEAGVAQVLRRRSCSEALHRRGPWARLKPLLSRCAIIAWQALASGADITLQDRDCNWDTAE